MRTEITGAKHPEGAVHYGMLIGMVYVGQPKVDAIYLEEESGRQYTQQADTRPTKYYVLQISQFSKFLNLQKRLPHQASFSQHLYVSSPQSWQRNMLRLSS